MNYDKKPPPKRIHLFGRKFYEDSETGFWLSVDQPRVRAHRWVWIKFKGTIPKGHSVRHKNGDKSDNRIDNLDLAPRGRKAKCK